MAGDGWRRTARALEGWVEALPAEWYDVRAVRADQRGEAIIRQYRPEQLPAAAGWLRRLNAQGWSIYGRPATTSHVLVDDLDPVTLAEFTIAHRCAATVETSPRNFQTWLTVSVKPIEPGLATRVARALADRYGADRFAADAFHLGRLPGLCNRKPAYFRPDAGYPWVVLRHAAPGVCPRAAALIHSMSEAAVPIATHAISAIGTECRTKLFRSNVEEYIAGMKAVVALLPPEAIVDRSRMDFAIARNLLSRGVSEPDVVAVVRAGPRAASLPEKTAEQYVARTITAARAAVTGLS